MEKHKKQDPLMLIMARDKPNQLYSAIGLLECGYKVAVVENATASPGDAHESGLERLSGAGALLTNIKSLYYEWIRTVQKDNEFMSKYASELPDPDIDF